MRIRTSFGSTAQHHAALFRTHSLGLLFIVRCSLLATTLTICRGHTPATVPVASASVSESFESSIRVSFC